ncbi:MAG: hypothetical protein K5829_04385 [Treponema sp.]|nr:hypothetical protein [Treponema sp.]
MEEVFSKTGVIPSYYVITSYDDNDKLSVFFDSQTFDENTYARDMVVCSAPFFVATAFDHKSHISFSFAFLSKDLDKCQLVSEAIYRLYLNGELDKLAHKYSVKYNIEFSEVRPSFSVVSIIAIVFVFLLILLIVGIIIWTIIYSKSIAERKEKTVKELDEQITFQLEKDVVEKYEAKLIEPVTGLFSSFYIKEQIKKEITQFDVFGRNFSVAIFTTKEYENIENIKKIAEIIKENLNSGVVTSYKGDGVFLVLFSNKGSDEIGIFVDLVVEKIYQANISVSSDIFDFKGQMTFLGKLGLDERNKNVDTKEKV